MINQYSGNFYSLRHKETSYAADKIMSILFGRLPNIHSAIDVGCGVGTFLLTLNKQGVKDILGLDGDWVNRDMLVIPHNNFKNVNLTTPPDLKKKYDLAICLEVAEHLPVENAEKFIGWLCGLSENVLFSAAIPYQGGVNHLNEAWQSYWAKLFANHGFHCVDSIRSQIWDDQVIPFWYRQNILFYTKEAIQPPTSQIYPLPLDLVHPELYLMKSDQCQSNLLQKFTRRVKIFINRFKITQ